MGFVPDFLFLSMVYYALLCIHSSVAIILKRNRKLISLILLSYRCIVTINVLWLFLTVPWAGMQCVIVILPYHTHLLSKGTLNHLSVSWGGGLRIFCPTMECTHGSDSLNYMFCSQYSLQITLVFKSIVSKN